MKRDARNAHGGSNQPEALHLLLERGADSAAVNRHGHPPLADAVESNALAAAALLLERGADPSRQDGTGKTALHEAVVAGTVAWVRLILCYRPDATLRTRRSPTQPDDESALDYARRRRKPALVRLLEAAAVRGP